MTSQRFEHHELFDTLTRYYLLVDSFSDLDALRMFFTDDAVWETYDHGSDQARMRFDPIDKFRLVAEEQGGLARSARLRHHITGLSHTPSQNGVRSRIKVLVTMQPDTNKPPSIQETAIITCDWVRLRGDWKIARWRIDRDTVG